MASDQKSYYDIDGEQYPRVTHILGILDKPGLARWRGRLGNAEADKVAKDGSDIGTAFHEVAAQVGRGEHQDKFWRPPSDLAEMTTAYINWFHRNIESVQEVEHLVYSNEMVYAGTMDLYATIRGDSQPSIIDIKTSNAVGPDWPLQLTAYQLAAAELGLPSKRRIVIRVPKVGKIEVEAYEYKDHDEDAEAWVRTLGMWRWMQRDKDRTKLARVIAGF